MFRKYAEKYLSRRLINGNSVGEECEQILLKGLSVCVICVCNN